MQFIFGLGNPGEKYQLTRHNVGFMVVDKLAEALKTGLWKNEKNFQSEVSMNTAVLLAKPQTFMNDSGHAVRAILDYYDKEQVKKAESLPHVWVIHDDLDLEVGKYKIQLGTGPKIHNGLNSIYDHLHHKNFWHVRVGVDGRKGDRQIPSDRYVLAPFTNDEQVLFNQAMVEVLAELYQKLSL
jgi:PTH1 family peptidyl-tRNA hydrolase